MAENQYFFENNRKNAWYGLVIMVIVLILLFFLVTSLFKILYYLSPLLLILTLIFDYKVVIRYVKMLGRFFRKNWLFGILLTVLSVLAFPLVTAGLFFNAFMNWRMRRAEKRYGVHHPGGEKKFSDFELLEEEEIELKQEEKIQREDSQS